MEFWLGVAILGLIFGSIYCVMIKDLGFLEASGVWLGSIAITALIFFAVHLITA